VARHWGWPDLVEAVTDRDHPPPNPALEPSPYSFRSATASGRGSPPALGSDYDEIMEMLDVGEQDRLLLQILRGTSDANIPFDGLCHLLRRLSFAERIRGSHHIFTKEGVEEILNLQPKGRQAKPYQVRQVRSVMLKYRFGGAPDAI